MGQSLALQNLVLPGSPGKAADPRSARRLPEVLDADLEGFDRSVFAQVKKGKLTDYYEVLEELGAGSFGVVSRGRDILTNSSCAIKKIPKRKINDPEKVKEEFNVIRHLDHPHICKAYECYEDRKNIYLVMELLSGGTLLETLCRQSRFTEADAANIMRQIFSALAYLHQANFIFRDLKTENVMFRSQAEDDGMGGDLHSHRRSRVLNTKEIKLIDFGLCCPFERGSKMCRAAGTPYSVAPELVTSPVQYDQKCDAWSAGVVMFILLSGKYPFNGKTKDELLHNIRREPCSFSHPIWKKISKEAKTLLADLMRKKASQRTSVGEALQHPWLARRQVGLPSEDIADVVESFKHFQRLNMFQKAAVTALAWRATDDETAHLREVFSALDQDGDGRITVQEIRHAIEQTGVEIPEDLEVLAAQADTDGGGSIEYTEFLAATLDKRTVIREEVVWEAFRIFDQDGNGTITKQELLKILSGNTGEKIRQAHGNKAVENFLDEYDVSGDAEIDFEEFMEMLQNVKDTFKGGKDSPAPGDNSSRGGGVATYTADSGGGRNSARSRPKGESPGATLFGLNSPGLQRSCPCMRIVKAAPEVIDNCMDAVVRGQPAEVAPSPPRSPKKGPDSATRSPARTRDTRPDLAPRLSRRS